jgi:alpha-ketoglutarate-dependent taurine dioxygenase
VPASITEGGHIELADRAAMGTDRTALRAVRPQWGTSFLEGVEALIELRAERLPSQGRDAMLRECAILVNEL